MREPETRGAPRAAPGQALLPGRMHRVLGEVACVAEGSVALALSRGGARKTYPHTDPNEDAAAFARGDAGVWAAVADAHRGAAASESALEHLLATRGSAWTGRGAPAPEAWREAALEALWEAHRAALRGAVDAGRPGSRTTLALAVHAPASGRILFAALGDSHVFRIGEDASADLAARDPPCSPLHFPGSESLRREDVAAYAAVGHVEAAGVWAIVLATDGVSERGIGMADPTRETEELVRRIRTESPPAPAAALARGLAERANAVQRARSSGDNVAVAALWLGPG